MAEQLRYKNVTTRKEHQCFACLQIFPPKTEMNRSVNVSDGEIYSIYMCITCEKIIQHLDINDYYDGFDEGCVLDAAQEDNRFIPSVTGLSSKEFFEEYLKYLEGRE